ncbi:MAG: fumarylacetoacetate hydrolase family protein [Methyloligellaceae bacterium]
MKLVRYGDKGQEKPGLIDADDHLRDLSSVVPDIAGKFVNAGEISSKLSGDIKELPLVEGNPRLGPCVGNIGKMVAVGLNYRDHASEQNLEIPSEPVLFMKATSCICGAYDDIILPRNSEKTDWEVELGIVIGKETSYVTEDEAPAHIAGYCIVNDVSERAFQIERKGQWVKGKSCDTFGPTGPWLVTSDEVSDPQALDMWLDVNGTRYQKSNTGQMAYGVYHLVSYISQFMSLQPGDIIATGTPGGVGIFLPEPKFLQPGDVVELSIDGLGVARQNVTAPV